MNDKERFNMMRVEIERLRKFREDVRKKELKFKKMDKTAKDIKEPNMKLSICTILNINSSVYIATFGWEITNKIDNMLTFIEENEIK